MVCGPSFVLLSWALQVLVVGLKNVTTTIIIMTDIIIIMANLYARC